MTPMHEAQDSVFMTQQETAESTARFSQFQSPRQHIGKLRDNMFNRTSLVYPNVVVKNYQENYCQPPKTKR